MATWNNKNKILGEVSEYELLIDDTYELLIDDTYELLIQSAGAGITWTNKTKN